MGLCLYLWDCIYFKGSGTLSIFVGLYIYQRERDCIHIDETLYVLEGVGLHIYERVTGSGTLFVLVGLYTY